MSLFRIVCNSGISVTHRHMIPVLSVIPTLLFAQANADGVDAAVVDDQLPDIIDVSDPSQLSVVVLMSDI